MRTKFLSFTCFWLLALACTAGENSAAAQTFRVMTYNIHHGEGLDRKIDLQRIADLVRTERADVVALQEVDKGVERTKGRDFPAELAKLTGMTCVFSNNYHFQGGEYGNALLSRFRVVSWTNIHYRMLEPAEQRGLLQVVLNAQGRELVIFDTHLDFRRDSGERLSNAEEIQTALQRYQPRPVILCGDFNDVPDSPVYQKLAQDWVDSWAVVGAGPGSTIPAEKPVKRIDYIWFSKKSPLKPVKAWVPKSVGSDHLPVVVEFEWKPLAPS